MCLKCILNECVVFVKGTDSSSPTLSELRKNDQMEDEVQTGNKDQVEAQGMNLFGKQKLTATSLIAVIQSE